MSELNVNPDTIRRLAELAQAFHAQAQAGLLDERIVAGGDWEQQAAMPRTSDGIAGEFEAIVDDLEPDQQVEVVALLWLGRGDFTVQEWPEALAEAGEAWTPDTARYLIGHPLLAEHLLNALELHGYAED